MSDYLTADDVKVYLVDETAEDNELLDAEDFRPAQVTLAMKMAAAAFNELPPTVLLVKADQLPIASWAIQAVQEKLYEIRLAQLERNSFVHEAGNTSFNSDAERIRNLRAAIDRIKVWRIPATKIKDKYNHSQAYGEVG